MQMMIGVGIELGQIARGVQNTPPVVPTSPVSYVASDGWQTTHPDPSAFDPTTSDPVIVNRQGFDANGNPTLVTDTLALTTRIRLPYPDQEILTANQIALSDFVYTGDTIEATTNASAVPSGVHRTRPRMMLPPPRGAGTSTRNGTSSPVCTSTTWIQLRRSSTTSWTNAA